MNLSILNRLFDRVYCLSLPRYVGRRKRLEEQLVGVEVEWVQGFDAKEFTIDELRARVTELAGPGKRPLNQNIRAKNLAIWLGQYEVRHRILERGERALVLEDDIWFLPDAARRLEHYWEELESEPINGNWELLYLFREHPASPLDISYYLNVGENGDYPEGIQPRIPLLPGHGGRELVVRSDGSVLDHIYRGFQERISTAAYAISFRAVEEMLKEDVIWTNDWWVGKLTEPDHPLSPYCYCVTPCLAVPRYVQGEI